MDKQVDISTMPKKPSILLLVSDEQVSGEQDIQVEASKQHEGQDENIPVELVPPAAAVLPPDCAEDHQVPFGEGLFGPQASVQEGDGNAGAQITIKYADGREEVIHVLNADVRSVAKADQVIPALSASYPQTCKPKPLQSSSVPQLIAGQLPSDVQDAPADPSHPQSAEVGDTPKLGSSEGVQVDDQSTQKDEPGGAEKKVQKNSEPKYQSMSAPSIDQETQQADEFDPRRLFSTPGVR